MKFENDVFAEELARLDKVKEQVAKDRDEILADLDAWEKRFLKEFKGTGLTISQGKIQYHGQRLQQVSIWVHCNGKFSKAMVSRLEKFKAEQGCLRLYDKEDATDESYRKMGYEPSFIFYLLHRHSWG